MKKIFNGAAGQFLQAGIALGGTPSLVWHTQEGTKAVESDTEPAWSDWQRIKVNILSLLPLEKEL